MAEESGWARFTATVKEQQQAEAEGGYAAGDGPYYDSDVLAAVIAVVEGAGDLQLTLDTWLAHDAPAEVPQDIIDANHALYDVLEKARKDGSATGG